MSENTNPVSHPLPVGVYDNFTYQCKCDTTVTVVASTAQPHDCTLGTTTTGAPQ